MRLIGPNRASEGRLFPPRAASRAFRSDDPGFRSVGRQIERQAAWGVEHEAPPLAIAPHGPAFEQLAEVASNAGRAAEQLACVNTDSDHPFDSLRSLRAGL